MDPESRVLRLAAAQSGVIRRRQALDCGMSLRTVQRRICSGLWRVPATGVG